MNIKFLPGAVLIGSLLLGAQAASAADTLLASTQLQLSDATASAELWGDRLPNGYANDLLVLLKDKNKQLITAYRPSIKGGYNCLLSAVRVQAEKTAKQQLLLSAGQGDWCAPSEYRILSFADAKKVQEIFATPESMGIVSDAYIKENKLQLKLLNEKVENVQPEQGIIVHDGKLNFGGLHSLTVWDVDNDGMDELFASQRLVQGKTGLVDIGVEWKRDKENKKWEAMGTTIMTLSASSKGNTVNDGSDVPVGTILPRRVVVRGGEATFPVFASKDVQLQNKINTLLTQENKAYLQAFYQGEADMAFKVMRADDKLMSLQLISGKTSFVHHYVNINTQTGEKISIDEVLNTKDKDLLPLLNVLNTNKAVIFKDKLPEEWYVEGENLYLMQHVNGRDEMSGFALGNLHKFILDKKIFRKD